MISKKFAADAIHGDLTEERDKVMGAFKNEKLQIIVATDLAARGLDIQGLTYVAHYTFLIKRIFIRTVLVEQLEGEIRVVNFFCN